MVDFQKKIHNTDKFRQPALTYVRTGSYCMYPPGTTEYTQFWEEEQRRCVDGYTADDGDYITGYNYFYLNYCPIGRIVYEKVPDKKTGKMVERRTQSVAFPDFYDYDYYYFQAIQEAEESGKHMCVLKSRRKGFSYKNAALACRNYYMIPNSKSYIYASDQQFLLGDGTMTKVNMYMSFIDQHTAFAKKKLISKAMHKKSGFLVKDEYGNETEMGYKSEIIAVSLKASPDKVRGKSGKLILFEEAGTFSELKAAWSIARPSVEQDGIAYGLMLAFGTGGDTRGSNFDALRDMFYHPGGYNCLEFQNIWDEGNPDKPCGFFCPQYTNLEVHDKEGNRLYMDKDGNTLHKKSLDYILSLRKDVVEKASNSVTIDRYVAENCITPAEACLNFNGNIFPRKELQEQLSRIRTNKHLQNCKQVGDLVETPEGEMKWVIKKHGDITKYHLEKEDDPTGAIVIWEHPNKEASPGLYIAGIDSYDYDSSTTTSLGSCFIYKRIQTLEEYSDIIVAEYTGRPATAEMFYENVRKLLIYYNAKAMYENQNKGIFVYFTQKHCDYLLADQPDIINDVVSDSKVNRKKGCHMNKQIKLWGEGLIKDWLNDLDSTGKKNVFNILSEPLLEELIEFNDAGNYDRCLVKGTKITTDDGFKAIENITKGDAVLSHTGELRKVTWVDKHVHSGCKITLKLTGDYRTVVCTENHPILTAFTDKKTHRFRKDAINNVVWKRADTLTNKYQFGLIPKRRGLKNIELSDDVLYLLGWVMSDGYVSQNSNVVRITYQINQLNCATKCLNIIEEYLKDETFYYSKNNKKRITRKPARIFRYNNCWRLEIASQKLHQLCWWFGCLPNNKHINSEIYNKYVNLMPFVVGYFEGGGYQRLNVNHDGCQRNGLELSTVYETLIHQVRQIMIDNGVYSSIRKLHPRNGKPQYSVLLSNEHVNRLLNYYDSLKFVKIDVKRNTCKCLETKDGFWAPIKIVSITPCEEEVYNFEVEADHSYVADGVVVHNCMALIQLMIYREQLYHIVVKKKEEVNKNRVLFDGPIFAQSWFDDGPKRDFEDNVYTF